MCFENTIPAWLQAMRRRLPEIVLFLSLLACGIKLTHSFPKALDLDYHDESKYIAAAAGSFSITPDWSPLYAKFLSVYFHFMSDPTDVYFLNFRVLTVLIAMMVFVLATLLEASPFSAFAAAFLVLFAVGNGEIYPKVTHFSAVLILAILVVLNLLRASPRMMFASLTVFSVILSYVRPELLFSGIFFFMLFFHASRGRPRVSFEMAVCLLSYASCFFFCFWAFGGPPLGVRSTQAFSLSAVSSLRERLPQADPLQSLPDDELYRHFFGSASGLLQAAFQHSGACLEHWVWNLGRLSGHLKSLFCIA